MTKAQGNPNTQPGRVQLGFEFWLFLGHLSFVIRMLPCPLPLSGVECLHESCPAPLPRHPGKI